MHARAGPAYTRYGALGEWDVFCYGCQPEKPKIVDLAKPINVDLTVFDGSVIVLD